jgi:diguanylate cyclase (GGDEF)-like protein
LDVDRFKVINDTHGHAAGDAVLKEFAKRIRRAVRQRDTVARLPGDEFVAVLEDIEGNEVARAVAGDVLEVFNEPMKLGDLALSVGTPASA